MAAKKINEELLKIYFVLDEIKKNYKWKQRVKNGIIIITNGPAERIPVREEIKKYIEKRGIKVSLRKMAFSSLEVLSLGSKGQYTIGFKYTKRGAGAGDKITALQECGACIALALRQKKGKKINKNDFTLENVKKVKQFYSVNEKDENILNFLHGDESWLKSVILTANSLILKIGTGWKFHRGDVFVKQIERVYLNIKNKTLKIPGLQFNINKWNPSDIWCSKIQTFNIPQNINNIFKLNEYLYNLYKTKKLIGVSLKKVINTPRIQEYKYKQINIKFNKPVKDKISPFNAKHVNVEFKGYKNGKFQLRNPNKMASIKGELLGSNARHGNLGYKAMEFIISKNSNLNFKITNKNEIIGMPFEKKINYLYSLYSNVFNINKDSFLEAYRAVNEKKPITDDYFISKIQSLEIVNGILKMPANKRDATMTDIFMYAASLGLSGIFESSIYLKVF